MGFLIMTSYGILVTWLWMYEMAKADRFSAELARFKAYSPHKREYGTIIDVDFKRH